MWWDPDLGNPSDDYVGCDTLRNMMYVYNGDNLDESIGAITGYQNNPPAVGIKAMNKNMDNFTYFNNQGAFPYNDPNSAIQYYNFMNGKWADGSDMVVGGSGAAGSSGATTTLTKFAFPGNPNNMNSWNEVSSFNAPGDRRGVMTMEAESLPSGASECYDFAILFAREQGNNGLQNVNALISQAVQAQIDFDAMTNYNCNSVTLNTNELSKMDIGLYPNPNQGRFAVRFDQLLSGVIRISDISGRVVYDKTFLDESEIEIQLKEKSGVYFLSLKTNQGMIHKKINIQND